MLCVFSFKTLVQAKYDADAEEKGEEALQVNDVMEGQKKNLQKPLLNP